MNPSEKHELRIMSFKPHLLPGSFIIVTADRGLTGWADQAGAGGRRIVPRGARCLVVRAKFFDDKFASNTMQAQVLIMGTTTLCWITVQATDGRFRIESPGTACEQ